MRIIMLCWIRGELIERGVFSCFHYSENENFGFMTWCNSVILETHDESCSAYRI